jgi:alkylation response protein AidB-like acyl-CoA dehydrogenase
MNQTADRIFVEISKLAPDIVSRAAEIEAARRMPPDLVERLRSIGVFRMFVPRSHGGLEWDMPTGLDVVRALSRIDGSVGWIAMIGSGNALVPSLLPRDIYEQIYRNGPDAILAGSVLPGGTAEAAPGGWRVKGRWAFSSGCQHADWMFGLCVVTEDGKPLSATAEQAGPPLMRACIRAARDWEIEDTWHVGGLKGTGSHHVSLSETVVPAGYLFDLMGGSSCLPGPLYQAAMQLIPLFHCAFAVGVAEGALDALFALARTGRQQLWVVTPLRDSETFQGAIGRVVADLDAARALSQAQIASHWRHALAGTLTDRTFFTRATQSAIWITSACLRIVDTCFRLGGGSALYENSPLPRQLRDMHAAAQHGFVHERHYVGGGKLLLETETTPTFL